MRDILAAGKKPVEILSADDVDVAPAALTVASTERPEARARKRKMFSSADELIAGLRQDGVL
ncbi:MAG: hypothetical protein GX037_02585 [Trueperella sp.]|nr:hypothetical protein [Trueperella sp.]